MKLGILALFIVLVTLIGCSNQSPEKLTGVWEHRNKGEIDREIAIYETYAVAFYGDFPFKVYGKWVGKEFQTSSGDISGNSYAIQDNGTLFVMAMQGFVFERVNQPTKAILP